MITESSVHHVYVNEKRRNMLFTKSLIGKALGEEEIERERSETYRRFNPYHSKLAALITQGCRNIHLKEGDYVLYLGCSTGTTPTHVADIVGKDGLVFGIDIAPRVIRTFFLASEQYPNLVPMLADAGHPETYANRICEVDFLYQDVAARQQLAIFLENSKLFLKPGGFAFFAVKARSIDVTKKPGMIFQMIKQQLMKEFVIVEERKLDPFSKDHMAFLVKKR